MGEETNACQDSPKTPYGEYRDACRILEGNSVKDAVLHKVRVSHEGHLLYGNDLTKDVYVVAKDAAQAAKVVQELLDAENVRHKVTRVEDPALVILAKIGVTESERGKCWVDWDKYEAECKYCNLAGKGRGELKSLGTLMMVNVRPATDGSSVQEIIQHEVVSFWTMGEIGEYQSFSCIPSKYVTFQ